MTQKLLKTYILSKEDQKAFKDLPQYNPGTLKYLKNGTPYREYIRTARSVRLDSIMYPEDFDDPSKKKLVEAFDLFGYRKAIIKLFLDPVTKEPSFAKFEYYG